MLSDQDDVWLCDKIETSIERIQQLEKQSGNVPLLVFSDKEIVDNKLQLLCTSYFKLKKIPKNWHLTTGQLCQQNVVSGCTMLFNRQLLDKALPIPEQAYMHDWWLALVATSCGKLELIDRPLIKYRQHGANAIGANKRTLWHLIHAFKYHLEQFETSFLAVVAQSKAFKNFAEKEKILFDPVMMNLSKIESLGRHHRVKLFFNKSITRSSFLGRVALLIVLLKMKKEA